MNDLQIRSNFHSKRLSRQHAASNTLVVDELGLKHGRCRADIAVVNGHLIGYEIKSDDDSLRRLGDQVETYNAVFDRAIIVVGPRFLKDVKRLVPRWWGIVASEEGRRGAIHFKTVRKAVANPSLDYLAVAQLLWRDEAAQELVKRGVDGRILNQKRSVLYRELVRVLGAGELRGAVRERLKNRKNWRRPV